MTLDFLYAKIHNATVTEANLYYMGSITIDKQILDHLGLYENQKVQVVNVNNGARIETYIIQGTPGSGVMCLNGAAARFFHPGDKIIVMAYCSLSKTELATYKPKIALMNNDNTIQIVQDHEDEKTIF